MVGSIGPMCTRATMAAMNRAAEATAKATIARAMSSPTAGSILRSAITPASHVPLLNTSTPLVANAVKEVGIFGKIGEFLFGSWGPTLGHKLREFMKAGGKLKDFAWVKNYKDITSAAAKESAKKAAENAGKTGILSKIGGIFGKAIGPILFLGPAVFSAINEIKEGNFGGAVKEVAKGVISMLGYTVGGIIAAAVLGSGGWMVALGTMVISSAVGMGVDAVAKNVLGPSTAETKAQLAQQQQQQQQQNPFAQQQTGGFFKGGNRSLASFGTNQPYNAAADMAAVERIAQNAKELFESRNNLPII